MAEIPAWAIIGGAAVIGAAIYLTNKQKGGLIVLQNAPKPIMKTDQTTTSPWGCKFAPATPTGDWTYLSCQDRTDCESWCNSQTRGEVQMVNPTNSLWMPLTPTAIPPAALIPMGMSFAVDGPPCSEFEQYFPDTTKYNECIAAQRLDSVVRNLAAYTTPTVEQVTAATEAYFPKESPMYTVAPTPQQTIDVVNVYQESIGTPFRSTLQTSQAGQGGISSALPWVVAAIIVIGVGIIGYRYMKEKEGAEEE